MRLFESIINGFGRLRLENDPPPVINRKNIGAEAFDKLISLGYTQKEYDAFKQGYEKKVKSEYPLFGDLCETKTAELPLEYASHAELVAYWRAFNLINILSSIEDERAETPENKKCTLDKDAQPLQIGGKYCLVTFDISQLGAMKPFFFQNSIISISYDKKENKHSFATLVIARVIKTDSIRKADGRKKVWQITAQMPYQDFLTLRTYGVFYVNKVCSYYIQNLHQENINRFATGLSFPNEFLKPKTSGAAPVIYDNYRRDGRELNEYQNRAVQNVLKCMANPSEMNIPLIIGPPGTGKSHTIVATLENVFLQNPRARVLVCAPSNAAVNVLARRVVDKKLIFLNDSDFVQPGPIFRLGAIDKIDEPLQRFRPKNQSQALRMLNKPCLIFSTLNSCQPFHLRERLSEMTFDLVIIDEAAQSSEIETLMAFAYGCHTTVLVGDPGQLQPTVKSQLCANAGYSRSFFERYQTLKDMANDSSSVKLLVQYRMKESIAEFPSSYFYDGKLQTFPGSGINEKLNFAPLVCVNLTNSSEEMKNSSRINKMEGKEIVELIAKALLPHIDSEYRPSIGVICFYKAQVELIQDMLEKKGLLKDNDIKVNTVDSFQGQEKDIIFISSVRANKTKSIGFCYNENRLNVALTRAKSLCVLIINKDTFKHNPMWACLFSSLEKQDRIQTVTDVST